MEEKAIGLRYVKKPPGGFKGKTDCGKKVGLNFYFDTKEEADFVYQIFKDGRSRIPSGKKLLIFIERYTGDKPVRNRPKPNRLFRRRKNWQLKK